MDLSLVILVVFVGIAAITIAVFLFVRDIVTAGNANPEQRISGIGTQSLRRAPTVFDQHPAQSLTGRIDQAFDRLVLESDLESSPITIFLMLIASSLAVGGGVWLYYDQELNGIIGGVWGMLLPLIYMVIRRHQRLREIQSQLPSTLEMLSRGVHAGQSLEQAIQLVGSEAGGRLGKEFTRCAQQLEMGRSFSETLKSMAARIRLVDIRILTTTLIVQRKTGGNLADTLERMANVVRDRLTARRQMKAASAAGRASTILIAVIAPTLFAIMMIFMDDHIRIFYESSLGKQLLLLAVLLQVVGILWVMGLVRSES